MLRAFLLLFLFTLRKMKLSPMDHFWLHLSHIECRPKWNVLEFCNPLRANVWRQIRGWKERAEHCRHCHAQVSSGHTHLWLSPPGFFPGRLLDEGWKREWRGWGWVEDRRGWSIEKWRETGGGGKLSEGVMFLQATWRDKVKMYINRWEIQAGV